MLLDVNQFCACVVIVSLRSRLKSIPKLGTDIGVSVMVSNEHLLPVIAIVIMLIDRAKFRIKTEMCTYITSVLIHFQFKENKHIRVNWR